MSKLRDSRLSSVDVMAAYLRRLWQKASATIAYLVRQKDFQGFNVRLVVTLPANWPDDAEKRMWTAVAQAGIPGAAQRLESIRMAEPEAAIVSALTELTTSGHVIKQPAVSSVSTRPNPFFMPGPL